mgnify:CR=1 FL=1
MIYFVVAFGLLLHVLFWGVGLAVLAMPRPWRRFWPVLVVPAGLALQSLVVWLGAYADLPGTNSYAGWSEILPAVLLAIAAWRRGVRGPVSDVGRFGVVAAVTAGCLVVLVLPLALAAKGLTTVSLGSCDAGDYAAGARVFMEFARSDRTGFLGLAEVVRVMSVENFFDFWLRLNHFTPSALIALNGTILHCAPHELTGVLAAVMHVATVPLAFWTARAVMRYSSTVSVAIGLIYGLSPVGWYAVGHVAIGQLLAAQAIALITWAGIAGWRRFDGFKPGGTVGWKRGGAFAGVLAVGYALVLGSYNFILVVCLVPAVAFAGGMAIWTGQWRRLARWAVVMLLPLVACGVVFADRVAGLAERFTLFQTYDFGWRIPALTPEGWLGMVSGPDLQPWNWLGVRWLLAAAVVAMLVWTLARAVRLGRSGAWTAACLAVPILIGYGFLEARGVRLGTNASYDAYKLFAVFYPGLLAAACWWVTLRRGSLRLGEWLIVAVFASTVLAFNLIADGMFFYHLMRPALVVDGELKQLRKVEAMPDVASLNMRVPDMWSRLWANAFLLKKPQYFLTHTYEGRLNTPLRGDWDLESGIIMVKPAGEGFRPISAHYALADTRSPNYLRAATGEGWHPEERDPRTGERWQWTKGDATIRVDNPQNHALKLECTLDGWAAGGRDFTLAVAGGAAPPPVHIGTGRTPTRFPAITLPPGGSTLVLHSLQPAAKAGPDDPRELAACVFGLTIEAATP